MRRNRGTFVRSSCVAAIGCLLISAPNARPLQGPGFARSRNAPFRATICDDAQLETELRPHIEREITSIFSELPIEFRWDAGCCQSHSPETFGPNEAIAHVLERFPGPEERRRNGRIILAYVVPDANGRPGPLIFVSEHATRRILDATQSHRPYAVILGRALGRVLAHELAHRFLYTTEHAGDGILKSNLTATELFERAPSRLYFTSAQLRALAVVAGSIPVDGVPSEVTPAEDEETAVTETVH